MIGVKILRVVYLKVNRISDYLIPCVKSWVEIFKLDPTAKIFFLCDNDEVQMRIKNEFDLSSLDHEWIKSRRDSVELQFIVKHALHHSWRRIGLAHLTSFMHSREHGFSSFWNIDADDIRFFVDPSKGLQIFDEAEKIAIAKKINLFSIDIDQSTAFTWSFGVAWIDNRIDWLCLLKDFSADQSLVEIFSPMYVGNYLDQIFDFFKLSNTPVNIKTFYVEELRLTHSFPDTYSDLFCGIRYCRQGHYHISLLENEFGISQASRLPISADDIAIDIGLMPEDSFSYLWKHYKPKWHVLQILDAIKAVQIAEKGIFGVSVVILLNGEVQVSQFRDCVDSLIKQTYGNYELIVVGNITEFVKIFCERKKYFFPSGIKVLFRGGG